MSLWRVPSGAQRGSARLCIRGEDRKISRCMGSLMWVLEEKQVFASVDFLGQEDGISKILEDDRAWHPGQGVLTLGYRPKLIKAGRAW